MIKLLKILSLFLLIVFLSACAQNGRLHLIQEGKTEYAIIVAPGADSIELYAAKELQTYLFEITGVALPLFSDTQGLKYKKIIVAKSDHFHDYSPGIESDILGADGFVIKTQGEDMMIAGGSEKGVLYGVYTFLEDYLGCRMYAPDVLVIPAQSSISIVQIEDVQAPVITFRELHFPIRSSQKYLDWHKLHWKGTNQIDWGMWVHTFDDLVPPEEFYDTHPEYFSETNGLRVPYGQLCLSNPEVFDTLVRRLQLKMDELPRAHYWSVSQNDTYYPCDCEKCTEINKKYGGYSGSMIWFVNQVAAEFPDKTISTLAYQYTRAAPTGIKPAENVNIVLCSIECNRSQPIPDDPRSASFRDDIIDWGRLTDNILIWDYVVQFRNYVNPFPNLHVLQPNLRFFVENNAFLMFQQGSGGSWSEFHELRSYLIAKILWNPDVDLDIVRKDFLDGYYGAAGPFISEYINTMQDALVNSGDGLGIYGYPYDGINGYLSPELIKVYDKIFDQAENAVAGKPEYLDRVRTARLPLEFAVLDLSLRNINDDLTYFIEIDGDRIVREEMRIRLKEFARKAEEYGIERIEEHGTTPSDYVSIIENYLDKSMMENVALNKPVQLLTTHSEQYPVGGGAALTDGLRGLPDYHFNWLGFEGEDLEAIIDLGEQVSITSISADFLQQYYAWIWLPQKLVFSISDDGLGFDVVARLENQASEKESGVFTETFKVDFEPVKARFIKIVAQSRKTCPVWHIGSGLPCWIFIDEIVIE
ncbi:MAG: DUF4838 domain-containing protein [Bacteroidota bacterium]|nr:DUF4838 domain-containing protein [Bacteroidota bacterium]